MDSNDSTTANANRAGDRWKIVPAIAGGFLVVVAALALIAWMSGELAFVQIHSQFAPLHYNSAIGLLVLGMGLIALSWGWPIGGQISGISLFALGIATLGHYFGFVDFGIDRWAFAPNSTTPEFPRGGMFPAAAISSCLAGVALFLLTRPQAFPGSSVVAAMIGATLAIGTIAVLIGPQIGEGSFQVQGRPILGVLGTFVGGLALLACAIRSGAVSMPVGFGLPMLVGLTGIVCSLILWQALNGQQGKRLHRQVQFETAYVHRLLEDGLPTRVRPLADLSERWARIPGEERKNQIGEYIGRQPGYIGVAEIDSQRAISWIEPHDASSLPQTLSAFGAEGPIAQAVRQGKTTALRVPRSFWNGGRVLIVYAPHNSDEPNQGGLIGVMKLDELFAGLLNRNVAPGYAITVTDGDETIHGRLTAEARFQTVWQQTLPIPFQSQNWKVHVWPTQEVMARESLSLPKLALAIGFLTTTLLALAVHLAQKARWRTRELEKEVHDRKEADLALKQSEAKYRSLIENLEQGVFLKDRDGRYLAANAFFCGSIGRKEADVVGKTDADLFDFMQADKHTAEDQQVLTDGKKIENEQEIVVKDRKTVVRRVLTPVKDPHGLAVGVLGICWDVTEQRMNESRLRQAGKMDAIGQLAGGIAHDFNNLLTAILGNLDLMLNNLHPSEPNHELVLAAQNAATRAASLTDRLLGFSRQHQIDWEPTDVNEIVDEVVTLLSRTIDPRVRIETRCCPDSWLVQADSGQINQVLMNLCLNARDALGGPGKIAIETACVEVTDLQALLSADARIGSFVRLRVADSGSGMPPEVRARIFEPFFTTKEVGKGTGLGLAMVFAIVRQHQGWIECHSETGRGTQFDIFLPRTEAARPLSPPPLSATPMPTRSGSETILVADDEPMIRRLAVFVLERSGYTVLEAEDGQQAVELYERERHRVDLVLLDLTMPNLSGQEAFRQMLQINPDVKVMFASGYAAEQISVEEQDLVLGFVKKPYRPDELVQTIQEALKRGQRSRYGEVLINNGKA